ncbi:MAG: sulfatase [Pirellulaceae bacterium]
MRHIKSLILIFSLTLASTAWADERPNFVIFIADDVSWNDLGCYGNAAARTPRIDGLASRGIVMHNAYLTASSCSPSRASIMLGRYPHNTGLASELHRPWAAGLPTLAESLRTSGYYTAQAGKYHMSQVADADGKVRLKQAFDREEQRGRVEGNSGGHGNWLKVTRERPRDKPFFFWFAALDAHRDWDGDKEWSADEYGPKHAAEEVIVPPYLVDSLQTRQDLASYYNEITRFDHFVGKVVDELREQGVLDNTVVMVMADNGRPFPRAKTRLHDSGMKTPLVVHWPQGIQEAGRRDGLVSVIDIAPTLLELAGSQPTETMQGLSMLPVLVNDKPTRSYAFSEHNWHDYEAHGRSARDASGWLYIRNARPEKAWLGPADAVTSPSHQDLQTAQAAGKLTPAQADVFMAPRPAEELYFTQSDPQQIENLVGAATARDKLDELRAVMDRWQDETGDSVPQNYTPDFYDRVTGYIDRETGERINKLRERQYRDVAGFDRGAETINASGPR